MNKLDASEKTRPKPKVVIFDLDGCLWSPEMYELIYFSGGKGAPFTVDPSNPSQLLTCGNEPINLLGDVRKVMKELYSDPYWENVKVGISSRTDAPDWARELLQKFTLEIDPEEDDATTINDVLKGGPIEISKDSKVKHFERISRTCDVAMEDIIFLDNEFSNCRSVAALGVTVAYTPDGVTEEIWNYAAKAAFPQSDGNIVDL